MLRRLEPALPVGPVEGASADEAIVARVLAGDIDSFELLMRRYNQRLYRIARSIVGEDVEAEDVVQESYLRAYRGLSEFRGEAKFSTWLTKIAVHEASARRRRRGRMRLMDFRESEAASAAAGASAAGGEREASMGELHDLLVRAVDALEPELRTVFTLRAVEGLDTETTAECLDLTPANVKVRLHRARERLRTWIDRAIGVEARRLHQFDGARCDRMVEGVMRRLRA